MIGAISARALSDLLMLLTSGLPGVISASIRLARFLLKVLDDLLVLVHGPGEEPHEDEALGLDDLLNRAGGSCCIGQSWESGGGRRPC